MVFPSFCYVFHVFFHVFHGLTDSWRCPERISGDRLEQLEQQLRRLRGELQGAREELLRAQYQAEAAQSRASAFHQWLRFTQEQRQASGARQTEWKA